MKIHPGIHTITQPILYFLGTILLISFFQWISVQFLATYCAEWSFFGPIKNLLSLGSPVCHFVNKFQVALADHYISIWAAAAGAAIAYCIAKFNGNVST